MNLTNLTKQKSFAAVAILMLALSGCFNTGKPRVVYMPDMAYSPALKAQEPGMRLPAEGTIPRGHYPLQAATIAEAGSLQNPLKKTQLVLERGQQMYNTYCIVCHGAYGEGDGTIVPKFPRPPSLQSEKIRTYNDGQIYFIISKGQNLMPPYASQIAQPDRWAIVHYIRALQRAKNPSPADVKAAEQE